jgi:uncharacterized membrane protein YeaQ/YmgE (transglycosylase-associated protein family)
MTWILIIIIGGILGWIASKIMRTDAQQGVFLNIVVGIIGAALAGFLLSPLLGIPTINSGDFSIGALLIRCWARSSFWPSSTSSVVVVRAD